MARILFTFTGGRGHFEPLVPIARAAERAGHVVAVSGRPAVLPAVEAAGFAAFPSGDPDAGGGPATPQALREVTEERADRGMREIFAGALARDRAPRVLDLCRRWGPDVVVCDEMDFGAMVAAECVQSPYATVVVIAAGGGSMRVEVLAEPLQALRAEHGLPPDPGLAMLSRHLVLSPVPPSFRDPRYPLPGSAHSIRPRELDPVADAAPAWLAELDPARTVYFTLGTAFVLMSGDLFPRVVTALRALPVDVVVTVGSEIDPANLGPQPPNVCVEQHIPQAALLPRCRLVVSHGGSGSVVGALAHGLPMVLIPLGADQAPNAARCEQLGFGRTLDALTATPGMIADAVAEVLENRRYRDTAAAIQRSIAQLPGPDYAVTLIERLIARGGAPAVG